MISKENAFEEYYKEVSFLKGKSESKDDFKKTFVFENFIKDKQERMEYVLVFLRRMEQLQEALEVSVSACLKEQGCYEESIKVLVNNSTFLFSHFVLNKDHIIKCYSKYYEDNSDEYASLTLSLDKQIQKLSNQIFKNNKLIDENKYRPLRLNDDSLEYNHEKRMSLFSQYREVVDSLSYFYNRKTQDAFIYYQSVNYSIYLIERIQRDMNIHNNTVRVRRNAFYDFFIKKYLYFIIKKSALFKY